MKGETAVDCGQETRFLNPDCEGRTGALAECEEQLRQTQTELERYRQYQAVFERAKDAILIADDGGEYVGVNPAACELFGLPAEEIIGRCIADFASAGFDFEPAWRSFLEKGQESGEFQLQRKDGTQRVVEYAATANIVPHRHLSVLRDITERVQAQQALQESEQRLQAIIDNSPALIYLKDTAGRYIVVNRRWETLTGVTREQAKSNTDWDIFSQGTADRLASNDRKVRSSAAPLEFEEILDLDSGTHTLLSLKFPLYNSTGTPYALCGISTDITQRVGAERALRQNQALLENLLENLPVGVCIADATGCLLHGNQASKKICGLAVESPVASPISRVSLVEQYSQYKGWWRETGKRIDPAEWPLVKALTTGESYLNYITDIENLQGQRKTVLHSAVPLRDESGQIIGAIAVSQDITEYEETRHVASLHEKALWENQRLIQQIAEATPAILYLYDLIEQRNVYANRHLTEIAGYSPEDVQNMGVGFLQNLIHPEDWPRVAASAERLLAAPDGEIVEIEYRMRHAFGEWRWLYSRDTVFTRTDGGAPQLILGTALDITHRVQAEEELQQYRQQLERLVEERTAELTRANQQLQQEIAERQLIETQLIASAEKLQAMSERLATITGNLPGVVYRIIAHADGRISIPYISAGVRELIGLEPDDITANPALIFNQIHPDCRQEFQQAIKFSAQTLARLKYEYRVISTSGEEKWVRAVARPHRLDSGDAVFDGLALDITARKAAEEALQHSEAENRALVAAIPDPLFRVRNDGTCVDFIPAVNSQPFAAPSQFLGKKVTEIFPETVARQLMSAIEIATESRSAQICEYQLTENGDLKHYEARIAVCNTDEVLAIVRDITERKRAEVALRESEERFRQLAENLTDVFWMITADRTETLYVSPAYERLWGRTCDSLYRQPASFTDAIHPEDRQRFIAANACEFRGDFNHEYRIVRPDGSIRWIRDRAFSIRNDRGEIYRIAGIAEDITDRKRAEEERDRFFNLSLDILAVAGADGYFKRVNPAGTLILGYTTEEFLSRPILHFVHPDDRARTLQEIQHKLITGEPTLNLENRFRCQDGPYKWLAWTAVPVPADGLTYAVARDMTDRKQAESALRDSEEKFRTLAENTPDIIARFDRELRHVYVNPAVQRLTGLSPQEVTGKTNRELGMPDPLGSDWEKVLRQVFQHGRETVIEFELTGAKGARIQQAGARRQISGEVIQKWEAIIEKSGSRIEGAKTSVDKSRSKMESSAARIQQSGSRIQNSGARMQESGSRIETSLNSTLLKDLNAEVRYYQARIVPEFAADGTVAFILCATRDITERKQMEESLRVAQARLHHLLTASPSVIYSCKASGDAGTTFMGENVAAMLGYEAREFLEDSHFWTARLHPQDAERVTAKLSELLSVNCQALEYRFSHKDGTYRWMYDQVQVVRDAGGNPLEFVGSWTDITERKRAEEQLIRFRKAVESASDAISMADASGQGFYHNPAFVAMFGCTAEELNAAGGAGALFCDPDLSVEVFDTILGGNCWIGEVGMRAGDGSELTVLLRAYAIKDDSGELLGLVGFHTDITERKRAEASLQYRVVLEQLIGDISTHFLNLPPAQTDRGIHQALHALGEFLGVERTYVFRFAESGATVENTHEWLAPGIEPRASRWQNLPAGALCQVRDTIGRGEVLAQSPATGEFQLEGIQSLLYVPLVAAGEVVGFIGCDAVRTRKTWTEDHIALLRIVGEIFVTAIERRRFEQELELRAADLARSNAELEQFAYVASHDLQEPLRAVTSYTQLLSRRYSGQLDAKADEYIAFAVEGATRMQQLIKDLLMYSRVGTRGNELVPVDFLAVFEAAVANLEVAVAESGATVTHGELPTVSGDFTQLAQLLQNLISNALKYRSDRVPVIHVSADRQNGNVLFAVRDNGIGIDQRYSDRIFQLFQRLHTRDEYPGTGIGLAICKKIVERHGGRIWVESAPGQGSTFYFTIPGEQA